MIRVHYLQARRPEENAVRVGGVANKINFSGLGVINESQFGPFKTERSTGASFIHFYLFYFILLYLKQFNARTRLL